MEEHSERAPRIKVSVKVGELSSRQRGAVLGLIKDLGFTPEEIGELAITIPEDERFGGRGQKRK